MAINLSKFILHSDYVSHGLLMETELSVSLPGQNIPGGGFVQARGAWVDIPFSDFEIKYLERTNHIDDTTGRPAHVWATPTGGLTHSDYSPGKFFTVERENNRIRAYINSFNPAAEARFTHATTVLFKVRIMVSPISQ